jgi:hypothetical protein
VKAKKAKKIAPQKVTVAFYLGAVVDGETGDEVPAYGFDFDGMFVVDARMGESGRFDVDPYSHYGIPAKAADALAELNHELNFSRSY